jgi:hypothetical protein
LEVGRRSIVTEFDRPSRIEIATRIRSGHIFSISHQSITFRPASPKRASPAPSSAQTLSFSHVR